MSELENDLAALRIILAEKAEMMSAEQEVEVREEALRETLQGEFPQLSPDVVEGEVKSFLRSRKEEMPEEERVGVKKSAPEFVQESGGFKKSHLVAVVLLALFVFAGVVVFIGFIYEHIHRDQEGGVDFQPSFSAEPVESLVIDVDREPGSKSAQITVITSDRATEVLLYENTKVLERWMAGGKMKTVVSHEEGIYIYFAEVYFGNEKVSTGRLHVDFGR